jgi:two-component system, OmpR family, response regulator
VASEPHILIVDDDADICQLVARFLEPHGFRVTAAGDGPSMRAALQRAPADLVILDLMLPGEDGLALCRELRTTNRVPIIFLTALNSEADRVVGLEMGADDYLSKPFSTRELLARVRAVLRRAAPVADALSFMRGPPTSLEATTDSAPGGWTLLCACVGTTEVALFDPGEGG